VVVVDIPHAQRRPAQEIRRDASQEKPGKTGDRRNVPGFRGSGHKGKAILTGMWRGFLGPPPLRGASQRKVDFSRAVTKSGVPRGRPV
jgi:hypothetical protein